MKTGSTQFFGYNTSQVWTLTTSPLTKLYNRKTITITVSVKDENFLWLVFYWHRSCHCNIVTSLPVLLLVLFLGSGRFFSPNPFTGACTSSSCHNILKLSKIYMSVIKMYYWKHKICNRTIRAQESIFYCLEFKFLMTLKLKSHINRWLISRISNFKLFALLLK